MDKRIQYKSHKAVEHIGDLSSDTKRFYKEESYGDGVKIRTPISGRFQQTNSDDTMEVE